MPGSKKYGENKQFNLTFCHFAYNIVTGKL